MTPIFITHFILDWSHQLCFIFFSADIQNSVSMCFRRTYKLMTAVLEINKTEFDVIKLQSTIFIELTWFFATYLQLLPLLDNNYYPKYERCNYRHLKIKNISHLTRLFIERTKTLFKEWTPVRYYRVTFTSRGHTWRYLSGDRVNFPEDFRFLSQPFEVNTQTGVPSCNETRLIPFTTSPIHRLQFFCHSKLHCNRHRMILLLRPPLNNIGRQSRVCQADFQLLWLRVTHLNVLFAASLPDIYSKSYKLATAKHQRLESRWMADKDAKIFCPSWGLPRLTRTWPGSLNHNDSSLRII
jgi:hypothetical protein